MSALIFSVAGPPIPKARARVVGRGSYTPARTRKYESQVRMCARVAAAQARWQPTEGAYSLTLIVHWPDKRRRDLDNIAKSALDALNGVAWPDDSQVTELYVTCSIDRESPRMYVRVERKDDGI